MNNTYTKNLETNRIELRFKNGKADYLALPSNQRKMLNSAYLWSRTADAWVSRSTRNHWRAIDVAKKLGFTDMVQVGQRLSYEEELERKAAKAEQRAERYDEYARNARNRGKQMQSEFKEKCKDWSFVTQPNVNSSGGRRFTNYRNRIRDRFNRGLDEYRKSDYFLEKSSTAQETASMKQLQDKVYLHNRIEECEKNIRNMERILVRAEESKDEEWQNRVLENMEYEIDKLAFMKNCMDKLGGVAYSQENIKPNYLVKIRGSWSKVVKANKKTLDIIGCSGFRLRYPYAAIKELKIPEGWEEPQALENPYQLGQILTYLNVSGNRIISAFQVIKTTKKTITIQEIKVQDNKPIKDTFISEQVLRRTVKETTDGNLVVCHKGWYLHNYTAS